MYLKADTCCLFQRDTHLSDIDRSFFKKKYMAWIDTQQQKLENSYDPAQEMLCMKYCNLNTFKKLCSSLKFGHIFYI